MNRQTKGYFPLEIGLKRQITNRFMVDENIDAIIARKVIFIYSLLLLILVIVDTTAACSVHCRSIVFSLVV